MLVLPGTAAVRRDGNALSSSRMYRKLLMLVHEPLVDSSKTTAREEFVLNFSV